MLAESEDPEESSSHVVRFPNNEFYTAIMDEDLERLEDMSKKYGSNFLIKISAAPRTVLWKGLATRPLHLAASYRRAKSMQILLATGADPEMRDQLGHTALHSALSGWPSVWTTRPKNSSKFQTAVVGVRRRAEACLRLLFEHGIDPNAKAEGSHQSPLHLSVRYMALSAVPILASFGADVNAVESSGMTPLHMAAGILHKDIMASLIKEGADVNMRDQLLKLTQQPRRLQDICKRDIYLEYVQGKSKDLRERLPDKLHDFVFNDWEKNIFFVRDGANQDHIDDLFDMS